MSIFNIVAASNESTVVTEYTPAPRRATGYQSEAELEKEFIENLQQQGYEYLPIHSEAALKENLRQKLEELNNYRFSDREWQWFFANCIACNGDGIVEKTRRFQEDYIQVLRRDDGSSKNIRLVDKEHVHNNRLQVINQYVNDTKNGAARDTRYDVTILCNGLPVVHVELKRRGVPIKEAFNQIDRYQRDSFWAGSGLFEYVQIFVISNGTNTKYYSNTTRSNKLRDEAVGKGKRGKTSNSFEFASFWADGKNNPIPDLVDFTRTFFSKHTLLNILTRYCVFTSENMLLVMRPYQITATERILNRIEISTNYKKYGTVDGGGFVWHTTGSGKTLTSFKTARLATELPYIDKVLFVVDRKDLDYQTMKEYDRFEKGAANSNADTGVLEKQLNDPNAKIIITTIQKLSIFIKKHKTHPVYDLHVVIIFDECHRSQFGAMHKAITSHFKKYHLFGFTGTPITSKNCGSVKNPDFCTTTQAFGDELHTYTIVNAINDGNVLPFRIDFIKTMSLGKDVRDEMVSDIDREGAFLAPERITTITKYILDHFDQKTHRKDAIYAKDVFTNVSELASAKPGMVQEIKGRQRMAGFNSIFAVSSVKAAMLYYAEFKRQMDANPSKALKVALIYSFGVNEDPVTGLFDDECPDDASALDTTSRDFLDKAILDYNRMFKTAYDTGKSFQNYYKDVSLRMKNRELDLLIVVNMFLTGFDATTLNTLWVDKNLRMHGLIQAFSRTNRIYNAVKSYGNIVCFRSLQHQVEAAIGLFGDEEAAKGLVLLMPFQNYYDGYDELDFSQTDENNKPKKKHIEGYRELVKRLQEDFPLDEWPTIMGESKKREFISLFNHILRLRNILIAFDDFEGKELFTERDFQDYLSKYQDLYSEWKRSRGQREYINVNDDIQFETDLVKQVNIDIDHILLMVAQYHKDNCRNKTLRVRIMRCVDATPELRSKKDLLEMFIEGYIDDEDVIAAWFKFMSSQRDKQLDLIIAEEHLNPERTKKFMDEAFRTGEIKAYGSDLATILPPMSLFSKERAKTKERVLYKLEEFFEVFKEC